MNNFHYFSVSLSLASARARDEDDSIIDSFDPVRWDFWNPVLIFYIHIRCNLLQV